MAAASDPLFGAAPLSLSESSGRRPLTRPPPAAVLALDDPATRAAIDRLHVAADAHVSARLGWLQSWLDADRRSRPWILGLPMADGELRAVAPLTVRRRAGRTQIRCLGHDGLDRAPVVSRSARDADDLARALSGALDARRTPWTLELRQLPVGDAFADSLAHYLPWFDVQRDADRPVTWVGEDGPLVSRNLRKAESRARNRIAGAGLSFTASWICDGAEIARRLPEVRAVHRARDVQLRGRTLLDDPVEGVFYDAVFRRHLDRLELLEIRLAGELAAYLAWVRNGTARLVLDNRVAPGGTEYSAGLIANLTALRAAAADPGIDVLDWGSGVQRYKTQVATSVVPHLRLHAWSSEGLRQLVSARRRFSRRAGQPAAG